MVDERLTPACAVVLHGGDSASGLADILHQFLVQTLEGDPARARRAARLRGALLFRAAEDPAVCVRIDFAGGRVDIADHTALRPRAAEGRGSLRVSGSEEPGIPEITGDFITIAHLTTGEEGPFRLLLARRLRVRLRWRRGPFLVRALRLMQLPPAQPRRRRGILVLAAVALVTAAALLAWMLATRGG